MGRASDRYRPWHEDQGPDGHRGLRPLSFKELEEIRNRVTLPLVFKGVLSRIDAVKSVDAGADAIVVSHGAHILDYLPHPLQVMEHIVAAAGGKSSSWWMSVFVAGVTF